MDRHGGVGRRKVAAEGGGVRWRRTTRDGDDGRGGRREARDLISDKMDLKGEE
jgi:hypothetical protein